MANDFTNETGTTPAQTMQNEPRKHHYIPIFYSKQWCDAAGKMVRFTREHGACIDRRKPPAAVGWEHDLYRMPGEEGAGAQRLEARFFSQLDDRAAVVLRKLLATPSANLDELDVGHWSMFMRSLLHRSPTRLDEYRKSGIAIWWEIVRNAADRYNEMRSAADPLTHAEYLASRTETEGAAAVIENMPHLLAGHRVLAAFARAPWASYDVPASCPSLLLSDAPIVMTNGFDVPGGHIAMPVSPTRFIVISRDSKTALDIDRVPVKLLAKGLNDGVVRQARHFVAAIDTSQKRFIDNRFTC